MPHGSESSRWGGLPLPALKRHAREFALQILFQCDTGHEPLERSIAAFWEERPWQSPAGEGGEEAASAPAGVPPTSVRGFTEDLVRGVQMNRDGIDERIRAASEHWEPERMALVDRMILRLAIFELLHRDDIPPKVSINEYIEIAKKFSTEDSGAFVNGILDRISREHGALPGRGR